MSGDLNTLEIERHIPPRPDEGFLEKKGFLTGVQRGVRFC
jgi:hypothetical protein